MLIMAVAEYEDYYARQGISATNGDSSHQTNTVETGNASGQLEGRCPIPATDYFPGELSGDMESSSLAGQMVLASIGQRVTSIDGSNPLDVISTSTVMGREGCLNVVPNRDTCPGDIYSGDQASNDVASSTSAVTANLENEHEQQTVTDDSDGMLSTLPPLSVNSFNSSSLESTHEPAQEEPVQIRVVTNSSISDSDSRTVVQIHESHLTKQTFPETCQIPVNQEESSGYSSHKTSNRDFPDITEPTEQNSSARLPPLQMSEAGINELKCMSGAQTAPLHPMYSSFPARLQSFLQVPNFVLGDGVKVNRDLLALAGFFYSGYNMVTCFHCGCSPRVWGDRGDPKTEHRMISPYCRAIFCPRP